MANIKDFEVQFQNKKIVGNITGKTRLNTIFLHGAGKSTAASFGKLRSRLAENKISSVAFDFIGHGKTGGNLSNSSLSERTKQVLAIIKALKLRPPLTVIGKSMSGYTAIKLTESLPIEAFVLMAPGIYSQEAYKVKFGADFTKIIRQPKSWENSDAWGLLEKFSGKILIIAPENDEIVPKEISRCIYRSAVQAKYRELYIVRDAPHNIMKYCEENQAVFDKIYNKIIRLTKFSNQPPNL